MTANSSQILSDAVASQMMQSTSLHFNVRQAAVVITEDKIRLCLIEHVQRIEQRREWMTPGGVLLTLVATLSTTSFKDFILKASVWEAVFYITSALVTLWLVVSVWRAFRAPSVEDIVGAMKRANVADAPRAS